MPVHKITGEADVQQFRNRLPQLREGILIRLSRGSNPDLVLRDLGIAEIRGTRKALLEAAEVEEIRLRERDGRRVGMDTFLGAFKLTADASTRSVAMEPSPDRAAVSFD